MEGLAVVGLIVLAVVVLWWASPLLFYEPPEGKGPSDDGSGPKC